MKYQHESVEFQFNLPIKTFIHSVEEVIFHWHKEIELLFVIEGSIRIETNQQVYTLGKNDLMLINSNQIHNTCTTDEKNILLALQINPEYFNDYYPDLDHMVFDCTSFESARANQSVFDDIRFYLAKIIWILNKKQDGYVIATNIIVNQLMLHIIQNFDHNTIEDVNVLDKNLARLDRVLNYIDDHYYEKISLKDLADKEHLNFYYLSHLIKDSLGISFQDYVTNVRLNKSLGMLINSKQRNLDIALACGFSDIKFFYKHFKKKFHCTPMAYRKEQHSKQLTSNAQDSGVKGYLDFDNSAIYDHLFSFLDKDPIIKPNLPKTRTALVTANICDSGYAHKPSWNQLLTIGRAIDGLREDMQEQLRMVQEEITFNHIRFHGIFNDEMMVFNIGTDNQVVYNWSYVDRLFDFLLSINLKPFVGLTFMPSEMARTDATVFWWKGHISPPEELTLWTDMVTAFVKHCINRYGVYEVGSWYFEVWNEPDYQGIFWEGNQEDYFRLFEGTYHAIKDIHPDLCVGGPAIVNPGSTSWIESFLTYCTDHQLDIDFFSFHQYGEIDTTIFKRYTDNEHPFDVMMSRPYDTAYMDREGLANEIKSIVDRIQSSYGRALEIHMTEWNVSASSRDYIHDTAFIGTYITDNVLRCSCQIASLGHWTLSDIFEEFKAGIGPYHGGFGLINRDGIKKSAYYAYYLLAKLGTVVLSVGDGYIVTKTDNAIQALIYNYVHFDHLYSSGDSSGLSQKKRYTIFEEKGALEVELSLAGLEGDYRVVEYELSREHGSSFDQWVKMGAPEDMSLDEVDFLKSKSVPLLSVSELTGVTSYNKKYLLTEHCIRFIQLTKQV